MPHKQPGPHKPQPRGTFRRAIQHPHKVLRPLARILAAETALGATSARTSEPRTKHDTLSLALLLRPTNIDAVATRCRAWFVALLRPTNIDAVQHRRCRAWFEARHRRCHVPLLLRPTNIDAGFATIESSMASRLSNVQSSMSRHILTLVRYILALFRYTFTTAPCLLCLPAPRPCSTQQPLQSTAAVTNRRLGPTRQALGPRFDRGHSPSSAAPQRRAALSPTDAYSS
jgi:hypothetical protein